MKVTLQNLKIPDKVILFYKRSETRMVPRKYFPDWDLYILLDREFWLSLSSVSENEDKTLNSHFQTVYYILVFE